VHVPYKGGGPMIVDATAGHVETGIASVAVLSPHVRGKKLRALAVTGDKRSHALADTLGMDLVVSSPEALEKFLVSEIARWGKVVREHNIRGD